MFVIIIIIWIMMARWGGDEIMNNPTIKSHIYIQPRPHCIIMMMMRVVMIKKQQMGIGHCPKILFPGGFPNSRNKKPTAETNMTHVTHTTSC